MFETPNGDFPNYVQEHIETQQQYLQRIFYEWLEWVKQSEKPSTPK